MAKKLADDLIHTNQEYTKLRSGRSADEQAPREQPERQQPGYAGLSRPLLAAWSTEEIRHLARSLDIEEAEMADRDALMEAVLKTSRPRNAGP